MLTELIINQLAIGLIIGTPLGVLVSIISIKIDDHFKTKRIKELLRNQVS